MKRKARTLRALSVAILCALCACVTLCSAQASSVVHSLDGRWIICTDAGNQGQVENWQTSDLQAVGSDATLVNVPGTLQEVFPEYHGVVWYQYDFASVENPNAGGRALLRFWQAEYRADVWVNGVSVGWHEGGEDAFELDVTDALKPVGDVNRLIVRVLNATDEPIDGLSMANIPRRNNTNTIVPGCGYASGGLVDSVELVMCPATRIADVQLLPNWQTGQIETRVTVENYGKEAVDATLLLSAASTDGGESTPEIAQRANVTPGVSVTVGNIVVPNFKLWELNDPNLYTTTVELIVQGRRVDRYSAVTGFRDFRFANGAFRLNGKRIYVKCSHSGSDSPITHRVPFDPDLYRKDIIACKTMGFNMIRYIAGMPRRFQLDLCDRLGFMVYDECLAGWQFEACPERAKRFEDQTSGMIRRDRNHPSVVIWGLLNETTDVQLVLQAANYLQEARRLDPSRMVFLNSGGFDPFASSKAKEADYAIWRRQGASIMPAAVKNQTNESFFYDGTKWLANTFFLHPGDVQNEYAALVWTAPQDGAYALDATMTDVVEHGNATVDLHLIKQTLDGACTELWTADLNLNGAKNNATVRSQRLGQPEEFELIVDAKDAAKFNISTIDLFDALHTVDANYRVIELDQKGGVFVSVTFNPGASAQDILSLEIKNRNGEPVVFQDFGRLEERIVETDGDQLSASLFDFKRGEKLALVVGIGDDAGTGDTVAVDFTLLSAQGTLYDVNADFSYTENPNGVWTYGYLPAGASPNLNAFQRFEIGQEKLSFEPIGRFSNPYALDWQNELADIHPYQQVPHTADVIATLRNLEKDGMPIFLSEYGVGSAVDLFRLTRLYQQYNGTAAADAKHYQERYEKFDADWNLWKLDDVFGTREDFFRQAIALMARQRQYGINAIRANPNVVAHSVTGTHDQGISGEGLTTIFRELKPGTVDVMADLFAPLRFCNFVEPNQAYIGQKVKIEAVLVNEDVLPPGTYPVRYVVMGPRNERLFDQVQDLVIPEPEQGRENPMVIPAFSAVFQLSLDATEGECVFTAEFLEGAAAAGGSERFQIFDRRRFPQLGSERIVLWGDDPDLLKRLRAVEIPAVPMTQPDGTALTLTPQDRIIVGRSSNRKNIQEFTKLYEAVSSGANVLFLSHEVFAEGDDPVHWLPFKDKGVFNRQQNWLYHKDDWARRAPAFTGLPSGAVLDYAFYRETIPEWTFRDQTPPTLAIAGGMDTQMGYESGLSMAEWQIGKGVMILSTWKIQENLPSPIAERMLRNLLVRMRHDLKDAGLPAPTTSPTAATQTSAQNEGATTPQSDVKPAQTQTQSAQTQPTANGAK
ncbi:MAG: glycoside hydrolase family 2 TIM barrel-domain containing protein [Planctomycetia bacterium]|nr:glycoside hydrolase family 2 TIM barrel-domain containing protein [Planctomycetia bacterium]